MVCVDTSTNERFSHAVEMLCSSPSLLVLRSHWQARVVLNVPEHGYNIIMYRQCACGRSVEFGFVPFQCRDVGASNVPEPLRVAVRAVLFPEPFSCIPPPSPLATSSLLAACMTASLGCSFAVRDNRRSLVRVLLAHVLRATVHSCCSAADAAGAAEASSRTGVLATPPTSTASLLSSTHDVRPSTLFSPFYSLGAWLLRCT